MRTLGSPLPIVEVYTPYEFSFVLLSLKPPCCFKTNNNRILPEKVHFVKVYAKYQYLSTRAEEVVGV